MPIINTVIHDTFGGADGDALASPWVTAVNVYDTINIQGNKCKISTGAPGLDNYIDFAQAKIHAPHTPNFEFYGEITFDTLIEQYAAMCFRRMEENHGAQPDIARDGVYVEYWFSGELHINVAENHVLVGGPMFTPGATAGVPLAVRVHMMDDLLLVKAWQMSGEEPDDWSLTLRDESLQRIWYGPDYSWFSFGCLGGLSNGCDCTYDNIKISRVEKGLPLAHKLPQLSTKTPQFKAAGAPQESITTITVPWPTHAVGDVALLLIESCGGEAVTFSNAQGFQEVTGSPSSTGTTTNGTRLTMYWHRATGTSMASPVVNDPGNHVYGVILTFTGCATTGNPWDVTAAAVKTAASTSMTMPAVTTTVPDCLIVNVAARDNDSAAAAGSAPVNANLSWLNERFDLGTALGNGGGLMVWTGEKLAAGDTGTTAATVTSSINAYLTIALRVEPIFTGTAYEDSVETVIVGVTSQTELLALTESPVTTAVGVTSETDLLALTEAPVTVIVGVISVLDSRAAFEIILDSITATTGVIDLLSLFESVEAVIVGVTSVVEQHGLFESVVTDVLGITSQADQAAFSDQTSDIIVAETSVVDQLSAGEEYFDSVTTEAVAVTSVVDTLAVLELPVTVISSTTEVVDQAAFMESHRTDVTVLTGETDLLQMFNSVETVVVGVTSQSEQHDLFESVQTTIIGTTTSEAEQAAYSDTVETVIVAETSVVDVLNGEPPPPGPSRIYFGSMIIQKI